MDDYLSEETKLLFSEIHARIPPSVTPPALVACMVRVAPGSYDGTGPAPTPAVASSTEFPYTMRLIEPARRIVYTSPPCRAEAARNPLNRL